MELETNIRPISHMNTHAAETLQEMIDAIGILKLLAQGEHDVEADATVSHKDAINAALRAIDHR